MAVEAVKAVNVTKLDAGGSGDNYIADGLIKAVEKIWTDNYTIGVTLTNTSIAICTLPLNKKIHSIEVQIQTSASQTSGTLSVGFTTDAAIDTLLGIAVVSHNKTMTTLKLPGNSVGVGAVALSGANAKQVFPYSTVGTRVTIALKLNNWTMTTGTIKSIVRYT